MVYSDKPITTISLPGVETRELEPWQEDGETWRRLEITLDHSFAAILLDVDAVELHS